ncbi:meiosis-specific nuclear structural protein 1-like isoform X2 [Venturia canescens]|uniref:meiosis-specific nuclear structural protein 1-like isoform X2 n=1 Tax=Venturia canescens TaxID=32260 RepID=UPI001C9BC18C|nr:meiosis-specific nuclear structural protein 1-like isoform X2 [Venturia canescens]
MLRTIEVPKRWQSRVHCRSSQLRTRRCASGEQLTDRCEVMKECEEFHKEGRKDDGKGGADEEAKAEERRNVRQKRQHELANRVEKEDWINRFFIERQEAEQEEVFIRIQEARELEPLQAQQEQKLGRELKRRKDEEISATKRRQQIRNETPELKQLGDQLKKEYEGAAARAHLLERQVHRANLKSKEIQNDRAIQGWYRNDTFEKQKVMESRLRSEQYRRDLQEQLVSNRRLRCQQKIEERRLERKLVEDTLTLGKNRENERTKRERMLHLLAEQNDFLEAQKTRKLREKAALLEEEEKHKRILADKMIRENQKEQSKSIKVAEKEAILMKMTEKMLSQESGKREWEETLNELRDLEEKNYLEMLQREKSEEKRRKAREILEDLKRQMMLKKESRAMEEKIDRKFAKYLEREREKFLMEERQKEEKRRAEGMEYLRSLRCIEIFVQNQGTQTENEKKESERKTEGESPSEFIEKERSRMLQEHAIRMQALVPPCCPDKSDD